MSNRPGQRPGQPPSERQGTQGAQGIPGPRFAYGQRVYWRRFGVIFVIDGYTRSALPPYRYWYGGEIVAGPQGSGVGGYAMEVAEEELTPA